MNGLFAPPMSSTAVPSPIPVNTLHPDTANMTEAMTQAVQQGISKAIGTGDMSKQMLKNLERFDGKNRSKCLEWLSSVEIIAQHSKKPFRELVCQSMSPSLLHIFSSISEFASDQDIKDVLLANYSDVPSMAEAVAKLQNMQIPPDEPLAMFNAKFQQIHQVAYNLAPDKQTDKTVIIDYAKKLPQYPRDRLLKKLSRNDSYIKMLQDAFRNAIEISREISFVDATTGRTGETKILQINELDDSFPEYNINARAQGQQTDQVTNHSTGHSTDPPAGADHKIHHTILDQISEAEITALTVPIAVTRPDRTLDRDLTVRVQCSNQGTTDTKTSLITIKVTGLTNIGDQ